jgi:hypothetical protein
MAIRLEHVPVQDLVEATLLAIAHIEDTRWSPAFGGTRHGGGTRLLWAAGRLWTAHERRDEAGLAELNVTLELPGADGKLVPQASIRVERVGVPVGARLELSCDPTARAVVKPVVAELADRWLPLRGLVGDSDELMGAPGRPRESSYDWAWEQIRQGRSEDEVFRQWQKRPDVRERLGEIEDAEKAFKSAMNRRRRESS